MPGLLPPRGLGWKPELPDKRDFIYSARRVDDRDSGTALPITAKASRFHKTAKTDQRMTSACVGHSTARHWQAERNLSPRSPLDPYWRARKYRNWEQEDEGCYIRDAFKMLSAQGCTRDDLYPDKDQNLFIPPSPKAMDNADNRLPVSYLRLDSDDTGDREQVKRRILSCIASKHSFVGGVTCYDSFFSPRTVSTGMVLLPNLGTEREGGGHAMEFGEYHLDFRSTPHAGRLAASGFRMEELPVEAIYAMQSWGPDFGFEGSQLWFFDLNYIVDRSLCDDCWTSRARA